MSGFILKLSLKSPPVLGDTMPTADAIMSAARIRQSGISAAMDIPLDRHDSGFFMGSMPFFDSRGDSPIELGVGGFVKCNLKREDYSGVKYTPFGAKGKLYGKEKYRTRMEARTVVTRRFSDNQSDMSLVFFCSGDANEAKYLLEWVPGYGARAPRGAGEIKSIDVMDFSVGSLPMIFRGMPSRPIPWDAWISMSGNAQVPSDHVAFAPPYRYGEKMLCAIPLTPFERIDVDSYIDGDDNE